MKRIYIFAVGLFVILVLASICLAETIVHEVKSGETVSGIAWFYKVERTDLLKANPWLDPDTKIQPGDRLQIPLPDKGVDKKELTSLMKKEREAIRRNMAEQTEKNQSLLTKYMKLFIIGAGMICLLLLGFVFYVKRTKPVITNKTVIMVPKKSFPVTLDGIDYIHYPDINPETGNYIRLRKAPTGENIETDNPDALFSSDRSTLKKDKELREIRIEAKKLVPVFKKKEA
jgi:LysM repeat protein